MFNFKNVSIVFISTILLLIGVDYLFYDFKNLIYFIPCVIYFGILNWGSFYVNSQFYTPSFGQFDTAEKEVVITFDDGPDKATSEVLDILKTYNVPATFFCIGNKIIDAQGILQRMYSEGHDIGLHSFSHSYFYDFKTVSQLKRDLERNQEVVSKILGTKPLWFRPPYGVTNPAIGKVVRRLGLQVIGWSIRSLDTVIVNEEKVYQRIVKHTRPGSIVLLHDHLTTTPQILGRYLEYLKGENYKVVSLSSVIENNPYCQ